MYYNYFIAIIQVNISDVSTYVPARNLNLKIFLSDLCARIEPSIRVTCGETANTCSRYDGCCFSDNVPDDIPICYRGKYYPTIPRGVLASNENSLFVSRQYCSYENTYQRMGRSRIHLCKAESL